VTSLEFGVNLASSVIDFCHFYHPEQSEGSAFLSTAGSPSNTQQNVVYF